MEQASVEASKYSFAPKTNLHSEKILRTVSRGSGTSTFANLYEDADRRREKLDAMSENIIRTEHSF